MCESCSFHCMCVLLSTLLILDTLSASAVLKKSPSVSMEEKIPL